MNRDLQTFVSQLEAANELIRITAPVTAELEITEITDRVSKEKGTKNKALLFENVIGYEMPLLINALGSYQRLNIAFDVDNLDEIGARIAEYLGLAKNIPQGLLGKLSLLPKLAEAANFAPRVHQNFSAPCQEEVFLAANGDKLLDQLPILKCWPADGGPFITLPLVFTKDPTTGTRNVGMYRMQKYSNTETGFHVHWHHDAAEHFKKARDLQANPNESALDRREAEAHGLKLGAKFGGLRKIPVAVAIGADPSITYAATAPLPSGIDEMIFAGFLRKKPVDMVKCKTIELEVPADAEIILEGYVDLDELRWEGPFGDHTGFYSLAGDFPVFRLTALTRKRKAIYQATIVGKPPQEDCYLGKATERIFLPMLQFIMPEILDLNLPLEGVFHSCAIIKIQKRYPGHARKIINSIWGSGQMSLTKYVLVLDHDVNIHDLSEVAWRVFANTDPLRDTVLSEGPVDILDHASTRAGLGGKMGLDATVKWSTEGFTRDWPAELNMSPELKKKVEDRWKEYGLG